MKPRTILILNLIGLTVAACAMFPPKIDAPKPRPRGDVLFAPASTQGPTVIKRQERVVLAPEDVLNAYRRQHKLADLKQMPDLNVIAIHQAQAMASDETLSHDIAGSFQSRTAHLNAQYAAENVGRGRDSIDAMFREWKESYKHNKILLTPQATEFGLGKAQGPDGRWWWTLVVVRR